MIAALFFLVELEWVFSGFHLFAIDVYSIRMVSLVPVHRDARLEALIDAICFFCRLNKNMLQTGFLLDG